MASRTTRRCPPGGADVEVSEALLPYVLHPPIAQECGPLRRRRNEHLKWHRIDGRGVDDSQVEFDTERHHERRWLT